MHITFAKQIYRTAQAAYRICGANISHGPSRLSHLRSKYIARRKPYIAFAKQIYHAAQAAYRICKANISRAASRIEYCRASRLTVSKRYKFLPEFAIYLRRDIFLRNAICPAGRERCLLHITFAKQIYREAQAAYRTCEANISRGASRISHLRSKYIARRKPHIAFAKQIYRTA